MLDKYEEAIKKGTDKKGCEKAADKRFKFATFTSKLQLAHNDFVLSVAGAKAHQTATRRDVLPTLLDTLQDGQEQQMADWKLALQAYCNATDTTTSAHQQHFAKLRSCIEQLCPETEYISLCMAFAPQVSVCDKTLQAEGRGSRWKGRESKERGGGERNELDLRAKLTLSFYRQRWRVLRRSRSSAVYSTTQLPSLKW